jgi:4-amino-4-deoxy-L-arabinose transferase-like glycosyltransferase
VVRRRRRRALDRVLGLTSPSSRQGALLIGAVALVALGVRLYQLDRRTITHPELFAPGIPLPAYTVEPDPRYTVTDVVRGTLTGDIHPPAYYLGELGWTSIFGTRLFVLRLPSAVLGAVAVILLYAYARRDDTDGTALLAAALLALHGEHVFWSQHARMWVPLSCLALGSTLLLSMLTEKPKRSTVLAYVVVTAAGIWTDYYFWPFVLAQIVWAAAQAVRDRRHIIMLDGLMLAAVLGSPMLVYLHYQTQRGNFLSENLRAPLLSMLPGMAIPTSRALVAVLAVVTGVAFVAGVAGTRSSRVKPPSQIDALAAPVGFLCAASLTASVFVVAALRPVASRLTIVIAVLIPWIASLIWLGIRKYIEACGSRGSPRSNLTNDLSVTLLFTTLLILVAFHVLREPVVVGRGLVMLAPFVALVMARGVFTLRNGRARAAAMVVLLCLSAVSAGASYARANSTSDYQGLAEQIRPQVRSDDVIVVENGFWTTPVHYYFPPDRFRVIQASSLTAPLPERVWIVIFREDVVARTQRLAAERLPRYVERAHADARLGHAALFEPEGRQ